MWDQVNQVDENVLQDWEDKTTVDQWLFLSTLPAIVRHRPEADELPLFRGPHFGTEGGQGRGAACYMFNLIVVDLYFVMS